MTSKMTVEDVFVIRNRGVVATGRVENGVLHVGDTVRINRGAVLAAPCGASDAESGAFIV
jgi:translation elongation factor EF-Tu-like GTPase